MLRRIASQGRSCAVSLTTRARAICDSARTQNCAWSNPVLSHMHSRLLRRLSELGLPWSSSTTCTVLVQVAPNLSATHFPRPDFMLSCPTSIMPTLMVGWVLVNERDNERERERERERTRNHPVAPAQLELNLNLKTISDIGRKRLWRICNQRGSRFSQALHI